jgi:hypothetical protein
MYSSVGGRTRTLQAKVKLIVVMAGGQHKGQELTGWRRKIGEENAEANMMRKIQGRDLPQVAMISPPASRYEPGLFTFRLLLWRIPLVPSPSRI